MNSACALQKNMRESPYFQAILLSQMIRIIEGVMFRCHCIFLVPTLLWGLLRHPKPPHLVGYPRGHPCKVLPPVKCYTQVRHGDPTSMETATSVPSQPQEIELLNVGIFPTSQNKTLHPQLGKSILIAWKVLSL